MTHISPFLTLILTLSLLSCTAAETSILCTWTKVLSNKEVHYVFLHGDASPSLRLYHSAWSEQRALLSCTWSDDAAVIQNYFSICRERRDEFSDHPDKSIDLDSMFNAEGLCVSLASPGDGGQEVRTGKRLVRSVSGHSAAENHQGQAERSEVRTHQRVKRGFIVPGTLWCGSGNKAPSYADLGRFVSFLSSKNQCNSPWSMLESSSQENLTVMIKGVSFLFIKILKTFLTLHDMTLTLSKQVVSLKGKQTNCCLN